MIGKYWKIFAIIYIGILFRALIVRSLYPIPYEKELLWWVTILIGIGNTLLIWLIGKKLLDVRIATFSVFLYSISPWVAYLEAAGSLYILVLFFLLITFYGMWQLENRKFLIVVVVLIVAILLHRDFPKGNTLFSDIGIINAVNQFQGEMRQTDLRLIGRLFENRYIYFTQYLLFNLLKHFAPVTYFTSEYKLLNFSFSPPVPVGFLIPLLFGLTGWFRLWKKYGLITFLPLLLIIPSVLSKQSPSLSRLVIFAPVIIFTISYGFGGLQRTLKVTTILLVIIQIIIVIFDIILREPIRFHG